MKNNPILPAKMLLSQLEDALEERQTSDRRKNQKGLPNGIQQERRKTTVGRRKNTDITPPAKPRLVCAAGPAS